MTESPIPADQVRFFSGSSNPILAASIANELGVPLESTSISRFSNDNMYLQLGASVRNRRVYIVQSLSQPVNDHLMELLMMLEEGIKEIMVVCTHGVFTRGAVEKLAAMPQISEIVTTDTVHIPPEKQHPKLKGLSVASIFADSIRHNFNRESIGDLFVYGE